MKGEVCPKLVESRSTTKHFTQEVTTFKQEKEEGRREGGREGEDWKRIYVLFLTKRAG